MHVILLSLLPCLFWLAFFYIQDWYQREPLRLIAATFGLGAASALVALVVNSVGAVLFRLLFGPSLAEKLAEIWLVVGPVEEFVKMGAVLVFVYRRPEFDEPVDGVIYAAAAALGFAALENVVYILQHGRDIIVLRSFLPNPAHALYAALWGLALSRAKTAPNVGSRRTAIILRGWLVAAVAHALYDTLCLVGGTSVPVTVGLLVLFMAVVFPYVELRLIRQVRRSPFRKATSVMSAVVRCPRCGAPAPAGAPCWRCGTPLGAADGSETRYCLRCGVPQTPGAVHCHHCGVNLLELKGAPTAERRPHFVRAGRFGRGEIAYLMDKPQASIGKTLENDFVIDDDSVSKHHARLLWHYQAGAHVLQDLGATNGVYVNGQRVSQAFLQDGFEVRFGNARFVYRLTGWRPAQPQRLPPPMLFQPGPTPGPTAPPPGPPAEGAPPADPRRR